MTETEQPDMTSLVVQLLSAYVSNNSVASEDLPALIHSTRTALSGETVSTEPAPPEYVPAVTVRKSLGSKDHIISMLDGKAYKTLKRHLATNGLTPEEYRARYNLPRDYPMIAPSYSEQRRAVAHRLGLGRKSGGTAPAEGEKGEPVDVAVESAPAAATSPKTAAKRVSAKSTSAKPSAVPVEQAAPAPSPALDATVKPPKGRSKTKAAAKADTPALGSAVEDVKTVAEDAAPAGETPNVAEAPSRKARGVAAKSAAEPKGASTRNAKTTKAAAPKKVAAAPKRGPAKSKINPVVEPSAE